MTLITGGAGFIGSAIANLLVEKDEVVAVDNFFRGTERRLKRNVKIQRADVTNFEKMNKIFESYKPDTVIHAAWINGTKFFYEIPYEVLRVGLKGTLNVVELSIKHKVKRFVFISSSEVYQTPPVVPTPEKVRLIVPDVENPRYSYGGGKIAGELLTVNAFRDSDVEWYIIRPHNIYGPDMGFEHVIPEMIKKIFIGSERLAKRHASVQLKGSGRETRAFCYIEDFIEGLELIFQKARSGIYNIGTDEEIEIKSLVELIGRLMGVRVELIPGRKPEGSTDRRCPDISLLKRLGYLPRWSLEDGLKKTIEWYVKHYSGGML